jgi:hypothetical protein
VEVGERGGWRGAIPICVYTSSVNAPMNCGVALRSEVRHSSSMYWPIEYQRADLRRWFCVSYNNCFNQQRGGITSSLSASVEAMVRV